jgi:hypothetical protein
MPFDGTCADEQQLGADLGVRVPGDGKPGDVRFLCGELDCGLPMEQVRLIFQLTSATVGQSSLPTD